MRRRAVESPESRVESRRGGGRRSPQCARRDGFTLVELLVSAGLVVLMLLMFATVFQIATASLGTQRGIAENDQRARTLTTVLRTDLCNRTFLRVVAWAPGDSDLSGQRDGYLYISENSLDDDRDDVLAFTVRLRPLCDRSMTPFYGRAGQFFFHDANNNGQYDLGELVYWNQPVLDGDGDFQNQMAAAPEAEICYFLRNGNLYRRVMLIRPPGVPPQPTTDDGWELFDPDNDGQNGLPPLYDGIFWRDFDYAASYLPNQGRLQFHGSNSLDNTGATATPLGQPFWRFGHNPATGLPREYINDGNGQPTVFFGRFTHEETSFSYEDLNGNGRLDPGEDSNGNDRLDGFSYPFDMPAGANPYTRALTDSNGDGVIDQYAPAAGSSQLGGPRRSEDILMAHVHGFDVKVWDDALGRFVDVGHNIPGGDFYQTPDGGDPEQDMDNRNLHHAGPVSDWIWYGPRARPGQPTLSSRRNRVFDTWHREVDIDGQTSVPPPFRPTRPGPNPGDADVPLPMRALQITVRYYDVSSDQNRTLTLAFSLLD